MASDNVEEKYQQLSNECAGNFANCKACCKIRSVLSEYQAIQKQYNDNTLNQLVNEVNSKIINDTYSSLQLLNDFDHVKYKHSIHENAAQFHSFYQFICKTLPFCDINSCRTIRRHYNRNREEFTKTETQQETDLYTGNLLSNIYTYFVPTQPQSSYSINLLSRIHTYFLHSQETNRLNMDETKMIEDKLKAFEQDDNEEDSAGKINELKLQLISDIATKKAQALLPIIGATDKGKYITSLDQSLDYAKISQILKENHINIDESDLEIAFDQHSYSKKQLITDLCSLFDRNADDVLLKQILAKQLKIELYEEQMKICDILLHCYIEIKEISHNNFIKILSKTVSEMIDDIDMNTYLQIVKSNKLNGETFLKLSSSKFAKLFSSMTSVDRKKWRDVFVKVKKWKIQDYTTTLNQETDEKKQDMDLDFPKMSKILNEYDIAIAANEMEVAFKDASFDSNKLRSDLCHLFNNEEDDAGLSQILSQKFGVSTSDDRQKIYDILLHIYIDKKELNNDNLIKLLSNIVKKNMPVVNIEQCVRIVKLNNLTGEMLESDSNWNSVKFANIFKPVDGWKRKTWAKIYVELKKWQPKEYAKNVIIAIEEEEKYEQKVEPDEIKQEEVQMSEEETKEQKSKPFEYCGLVYSEGTRFWYWSNNCMPSNVVNIDAKYDDLREEVLAGEKITKKQWELLNEECAILLKSDLIKKISSNGNAFEIYGIPSDIPITMQHLLAIKLYTDYTNLCSLFCNSFRLRKLADGVYEPITSLKNRHMKYAQMSRHLIECVQCFGRLYLGKKKHYRGVSQPFLFNKFVTRFHTPLSTTPKLIVAASFAGNGEDGIIIELKKYDDGRDVPCFHCSTVSEFDSEEEVLFFGGSSVLEISSIYQIYNNTWTGYKNYIQSIQGILSIINGTMIKSVISLHAKEKMLEMLQYVIDNCRHGDRKSYLPPYVENLLHYHLVNTGDKIVFDWCELTAEYKWLSPVFVKLDSENLLNIPNLFILFPKTTIVTIMLPSFFIMDDAFCQSLLSDIGCIERKCLLKFQWLEMSNFLKSKLKVLELQKHLTARKVEIEFSSPDRTITFDITEQSKSDTEQLTSNVSQIPDSDNIETTTLKLHKHQPFWVRLDDENPTNHRYFVVLTILVSMLSICCNMLFTIYGPDPYRWMALTLMVIGYFLYSLFNCIKSL